MGWRPEPPPGPYLVVGLARSGQALLRLLGDEARGVDRKQGDDTPVALEGMRCVIKSPGVPQDAPVIAAARERGIPVIGEVEFAWRLLPNEFVAVTGTNGKTTTVELLGAIYREAARPVAVAGNVGSPVSGFVGCLPDGATVVCEASSFQLEDADRFAPEAAVFLNLAPDHLDRHPDLDHYLESKLRLFANQSGDDVAVLNASEPVLARRDIPGSARRIWYGEREDCDLRLQGGRIAWQGQELVDVSELKLPGVHNLQNTMAAAAAALASGIDPGPVRAALRDFRGIPHRLEQVAEIGGVSYVNDSKATNPAAAIAGIEAFEGGVHAILGGSAKGADFASLAPAVLERCAACYLIGEAAERLAQELAGTGVELIDCGDLERAVAEAARHAKPGDTVLLSPACASFDQYRDFEERGEHFRSLVEALQ
jgi:UDP-N-acetylmuramoylalanine--D-glutamate ligase